MNIPKTYVIYRDPQNKVILKYSVHRKEKKDLEENIKAYNLEKTQNLAEIVLDADILRLIEIAEENKKIKVIDLDDIKNAISQLQNDLYTLQNIIEDQK